MESMTRGSSCGMNGSRTGSDPAAMIAESKLTVVVDPSGPATESMFGEVNVPVPTRVWTLRCLASPVSPPVSLVTTPSFQPRSTSRSIVGAAKDSPAWLISLVSAITFAACSSALDGMQPTLRHTPPSGPRRVDHHDVLAQVRRPERRGVATGPGAEHQHLGVHITLGPGVRRGGAHGCSDPVVPARRSCRRAVPGRCRQVLAASGAVRRRVDGRAATAGSLVTDSFGAPPPASPAASTVPMTVPWDTVSPIATRARRSSRRPARARPRWPCPTPGSAADLRPPPCRPG